MSNLFAELRDNPVWQEYERQQDRDPQGINLTDLWRAAGRPRPWSPRWWRKHYDYTEEVTLEGTRADDPAWTDARTAWVYIQHIDLTIMDAVSELFFYRLRMDPAGCMLSAPDPCKPLVAIFAGAVTATDGDKTSATRDITAEVARRTEGLGVYAQEVEVAKVQRAFLEANRVRSGRVIDGEWVQDR
jgi:hypothetical protein